MENKFQYVYQLRLEDSKVVHHTSEGLFCGTNPENIQEKGLIVCAVLIDSFTLDKDGNKVDQNEHVYQLRLGDGKVLNHTSEGIFCNNDSENPDHKTLVISCVMVDSFMVDENGKKINEIASEDGPLESDIT